MNAPDFVVFSIARPEGERFALFRLDDWLRSLAPSQRATRDRVQAMEQFVKALDLMPEESMRAHLESLGLPDETVTDHIMRARKAAQLNQGALWEVVTDVGYRNEEGQQVVARTALPGSEPEQRVFVMGCTVCGHEYGSNGCDIPHRCCPNCQDGPAGLPYRRSGGTGPRSIDS